ncbi:MAG: toxin [Burkholderiales bacterium]|nr:toxin [Burkholderiales bacterium]
MSAERTVVIGTSGAGKSTFAAQLAARRGVPHVELDSLHWEPGWTPAAPAVFRERVAEVASAQAWVIDGNYSAVRPVLWPRATQVIWLNYSRPVVFSRIIRRTVGRVISGEPLWGGNRETMAKAFFSRQSILWWSFSTFAHNRVRFDQLRCSGEYAHLAWLEVCTPAEAAQLLRVRPVDGQPISSTLDHLPDDVPDHHA